LRLKRNSDKELRAHYKALFVISKGPAGQAVFRDLYEKSGVGKTLYVPGDRDALLFNDGLRSLFLHILEMTYEPDDIVEKLKEITSMEYL
jgi:hypothetical protein